MESTRQLHPGTKGGGEQFSKSHINLSATFKDSFPLGQTPDDSNLLYLKRMDNAHPLV